ncbi:MAG TPA: cupredoxin domain-containing protein [Actinomycetota bacterium]|nr:cupredoxin domain-containing protein [Actinomycetota bacterium]
MKKLLSIVLVLTGALTACGDDAGSRGAGRPSATTGARTSSPGGSVEDTPANARGSVDLGSGSAPSLEMEMNDFYFKPTFVKAAPGARVAVTLRNDGKAPHTFTVEEQSVDLLVEPATTATASVTLPPSGILEFHCTLHHAQGMHGAFYVDLADEPTGTDTSGGGHGDGSGHTSDDSNRY